VIVGGIRRKPVLTYASIVCDMLASVNSVNSVNTSLDSPGRAAAADLETESDNYMHLSHAAPTDVG